MDTKRKRMHELVELLNKAARVYYQGEDEVMSNHEYDKLYDELQGLENELNVVLSASPTIHVGYEVLSELPKEMHERVMLSLDKTKEVEKIREFIGDKQAVLSWKLDGLTIVLTYENGELIKAVTRGNGEIGEVITNNAKTFQNLPLYIPYKGRLVLRGEAVIGYDEFEEINSKIEEEDAKYKNPRNLCSGSVRQLNSEITAKRNVKFYAFSLVQAENIEDENTRHVQLNWLHEQGFDTVEFYVVTEENVEERIQYFAQAISSYNIPSDGLVLSYDDIAYGISLGSTAKFPRDSIAFKWRDEQKETTLLEIEWSPSRTGRINPVAIFEPVNLEGTTVSRASIHNISVLEELELGAGDRIDIYKANMIIPQIAQNHTKSGVRDIPNVCPVCGGLTLIRQVSQAKALYCTNPECEVKKMKTFALFVGRNSLNIEGLSEATLEKFISKGFVKTYQDIFHLDKFAEELCTMEGFGEKSYQNLIESTTKAKKTTLPRVLYGMGISNIGLANAKLICKEYANDVEKILAATQEELSQIAGIGDVIAKGFVDYFKDENKKAEFLSLLLELEIPKEEQGEQTLENLQFVVTGSIHEFANRSELKEVIESKGGKVTGSVTSKTNYLINNDVDSSSTKNKKARQLEIPIISEEEFKDMFLKL
jgi:DNA ligase, NAD-dependent